MSYCGELINGEGEYFIDSCITKAYLQGLRDARERVESTVVEARFNGESLDTATDSFSGLKWDIIHSIDQLIKDNEK